MADQLDRLKAALAERYRIERELGSGGMATVYLAQDLKHERQTPLATSILLAVAHGRCATSLCCATNPAVPTGQASIPCEFLRQFVLDDRCKIQCSRPSSSAIDPSQTYSGTYDTL
jgi:serine/threonine protein kinase